MSGDNTDQSNDSVDFKKYNDKQIDDLVSSGIKSYALKNYEDAVEKFGEACGTFTEKNDGKDDGDLLFIYGKALFRVAVSQSEVLGGTNQQKPEESAAAGSSSSAQQSEPVPASEPEPTEPVDDEENGNGEDDQENGEAAEKDETDFEVAWEILDLVRTIFIGEVEDATSEEEKKPIQKKLADVYDILGEVSLESENFGQAVDDLKSSLELKSIVYPSTDPIVSEAHFKLALAYEFDHENDDKKKNAIEHMEKAIQSVKDSGKDDPELIKDLETRLEDLKSDGPDEKQDVLNGILGQASGSIKEQLTKMVTQANDINTLVRKKPASESPRPVKKSKTDEST